VLALFTSGCVALNGKFSEIRPASPSEREGQVVLLRGWAGIWSLGLDTLGKKINAAGTHATVFQYSQWSSLAKALAKNQRDAQHPEPLVLIGHSYGADDAVRIAQALKSAGVKVDLLVTIDPISPPPIPSNVSTALDYFESRGTGDVVPAFRGIPIKAAPDFTGLLRNYDLAADRRDLRTGGVSHIEIEEDEKIHAEILQWIRKVCPPRPALEPTAPADNSPF
jgi:pimeloyl-ACP methyl ester carboxylesterase